MPQASDANMTNASSPAKDFFILMVSPSTFNNQDSTLISIVLIERETHNRTDVLPFEFSLAHRARAGSLFCISARPQGAPNTLVLKSLLYRWRQLAAPPS